ncbi:MAG TPA: hypothetical protein VEI06_09860 [Gemmatimonadaceae bacterium]|nr:hypothetical protein [Gemmatimonadaceae bacterium]
MSTVLLLGDDEALLEGLAQLVAGAGLRPVHARTAVEALELSAATTPLAAVIDREIALTTPEVLRLPLVPGGAFILYSSTAEAVETLPVRLARVVMAELTLPLERHRLLTLLQRVAARARDTGRMPEPPEMRG